jgi:phosphoserine phosphatase RsbU/P
MSRNWRPSRRNRHGRPGQSGAVTRHRPGTRLTLFEAGAVHRDLEIAETVQKRLLPQKSQRSSGLLSETYYRPLHGIGGDYYDFVSLDRSRLGIAIGDVSGKGVAAALIMANLQASLRALLLQPGMGPQLLVRSLNRLLYEASHDHVFASLFYGEFDPESRILRYVNAGHHPPLLRQRTI